MPRCSRAWREAAYQIDFRSRIPWEVSGGSLRSPGSCTLSRSDASRVCLMPIPFRSLSAVMPALFQYPTRDCSQTDGSEGSRSQKRLCCWIDESEYEYIGPIECKALDVSSCLVEVGKLPVRSVSDVFVRVQCQCVKLEVLTKKLFRSSFFLRTVQTARVESLVRR